MTKRILQRKTRIFLISLFSKDYPMICESHAISVLAGCLVNDLGKELDALEVIDLYTLDYWQKDERFLLQAIYDFQPSVIGISVPYGSYSYLRNIYPTLKKSIKKREHLVLFGGAIPTYLPNVILADIDKSAIVIQGEGEEAIVKIIRNWLDYKSWESIPNICYFKKEKIKCNDRKLINLSKVPPPYRNHIIRLGERRIQIFLEASRGCSWAKCTFCPRGLTDVNGTLGEYRCFPFKRLEQDLLKLKEMSVPAVTFSDEDFLGGDLSQCEKLVKFLEELTEREGLQLPFDVSMSVRSIYSSKWKKKEMEKRKDFLKRLKKIGLRKVFLGVESGSVTQLSRYDKAHIPDEAVTATRILRNLEVAIELGFIMFDPLCNLDEVEENINYLKNNKLVRFVSSFGSGLELRIQIGSRYLDMLKETEKKLGLQLFERQMDLDTLTYPSIYMNPSVAEVVSMVRKWNSQIRPLYYPLKSLSRYGTSGFLGNLVFPVRELVREIREMYFNWILEVVKTVQITGSIDEKIRDISEQDIKKFCDQILSIFGDASTFVVNNPIVSILVNTAKKYV